MDFEIHHLSLSMNCVGELYLRRYLKSDTQTHLGENKNKFIIKQVLGMYIFYCKPVINKAGHEI